MMENNPGWTSKKMSENTARMDKSTDTSTKTVFLKSEGIAYAGFGDVMAEYNSYVRLRPYLRMPRVRLINKDRPDRNLVVQNVEGAPLSELLKQGEMEEFQNAFRGFTNDLAAMWKSTLQPMAEEQLAPGANLRLNCLQVLENLENNDRVREIRDKKILINGKEYSTLGESIVNSRTFLSNNEEPIMSYAHGDEMLQNVISTPGSTSEYMAIDPRNAAAGYFTPAQSADYLVGFTFLFNYDWGPSQMQIHGDRVEISYDVAEKFRNKDKILRQLFVEFVEKLDTFGPIEKEMLREYLFANLARSYIDGFMPGNLVKTVPHKIAHLALAIELETNLDATLREPSYIE